MSTRIQTSRPATKHQVRVQRLDFRGYPPTGLPWGQPGWGNPGGTANDPHITSITPATLAAPAAATVMTVTGTQYVSGSVIEIDNVAVATTFVSATSLTTSWDPTVAKAYIFTVRNPNEEESNSFSYTVTAAAADPTSSWTKAEIVEWLQAQGVAVGDNAVDRFTKNELLAIVEAFLNDDDDNLAALLG